MYETVTEVKMLGYTFWQDGVSIQQNTNTLWNSLTSAAEDPNEEGITTLAQTVLKLDQQLGSLSWNWTQGDSTEPNTLLPHL